MGWMERLSSALPGIIAGIASGALTAFLLVSRVPHGSTTTISGHNFILTDANGKTRGEWRVSNQHLAELDLYDDAGLMRAQFGVLADGTGMFGFLDQNGKPALVLNAVPKGGIAALAMFNPNGTTRAELAMKDGEPAFVLGDHNGNRLIRIEVQHDQPALALYDGTGIWRSLLTLNSDGTPEFGMADQNAKPRAMIGLQSDGRPIMALSRDDGHALAVLGQMAGGVGSLTLYDDDNRIIGKVP